METKITGPPTPRLTPHRQHPNLQWSPQEEGGSLPPLLGQLEFITTISPSPPCSLWSPLESRCGRQTDSFLKETSNRGGRWQGFPGALVAGRCSVGGPAGHHRSLPLGLEAQWPAPLDIRGPGDWGAGVNRMSGSWTRVCHGPVGAMEEAARPGVRKQEGHWTGGSGPTLSRALSPSSRVPPAHLLLSPWARESSLRARDWLPPDLASYSTHESFMRL